jgi:cystathionine beta-lyase family protein involved in aluminum resistance
LPDGGFLRQIWTILADLKVVWRAKNISGGLPISGGFLADLTNFVWLCFCLVDSGGFGVSISKKQLFFSLFLAKKKVDKK